MIRTIKNFLRKRKLANFGVSVEVKCPTVVYGVAGGSWTICPDGITSESVVYSFGIGRDLSFDLDLIDKHHLTVHAFDPTPSSLQWVRTHIRSPSLMIYDYGIAGVDGEIEFYPPRKTTSAHWTPVKRYRMMEDQPIKARVKTLQSIMTELRHEHIDILKMDIEGGEYDVIDDIVTHRWPIRQLVVEFHHAYETIPLSDTIAAVNKLRAIGSQVFAISERGYEISFINKGM